MSDDDSLDLDELKSYSDLISELKDKIKIMQDENMALKKECDRLKDEAREEESNLKNKTQETSNISEKAKKRLDQAKEIIIELNRVKNENKKLETQLEVMCRELSYKFKDNIDKKNAIMSLEERKQVYRHIISSYEDLFSEMFVPPKLISKRKPRVTFVDIQRPFEQDRIPTKIQRIIRTLETLPIPFISQKIEVKREIMQKLAAVGEFANRISEEIHELEERKVDKIVARRIQAEIDTKTFQYNLIRTAVMKVRMK